MLTAKCADRIEKPQRPAPFQNTNELASLTSAHVDRADIRKVRAIPTTAPALARTKARTVPNENENNKKHAFTDFKIVDQRNVKKFQSFFLLLAKNQ